jgi:diaminohydroxyphosphoribosylaminopyrimidine deaminase/5-amino-6-(5-phosphoribosylamino)uracil reductase
LVKDGIVVGEGWHRRAGESHAEVLAIADAGPHRALGATAYVTLEPCNHVGRTPPCVDALHQAGISRLIVAMQDPNPLVSGQGLQRCRELGIDVRCGLLSDDAMDLNPGFFKRMMTGLPWVRVKTAISVDGRTALSNGDSQWITSRLARDDGHAWRARACAVLTGIGTVRHDNPQMNVRAVETTRQPLRVVVDARFEIDLQSAVLAGGHALVVIAVDPRKPVYAEKFLSLKERGVEVIELPPTQEGKVDLALLLQVLGERAMNEVHVEVHGPHVSRGGPATCRRYWALVDARSGPALALEAANSGRRCHSRPVGKGLGETARLRLCLLELFRPSVRLLRLHDRVVTVV